MATTVPQAVPEPGDGPTKSGLIASALAPVTPARTTFDLAPTDSEQADAPVTGLSSASYHDTEYADTAQNNTTGARQKQGIWRAWLLAGAARWAKGGGAYNKRLEVAKAKAQARQVKENRQVSVNRTSGFSGRTQNHSAGGGKSLDSKSNGNGPKKSPKNTNANPHNRSFGGSGNSTSRDSRGSGGGSNSRSSDKPARNDRHADTRKDNTAPSPKPSKGSSDSRTTQPKDTSKGSKGSDGRSDVPKSGGSSAGATKSGPQGPSGSPGKAGGTGGSTTSSGGSKGDRKGTDKVSLDKPHKKKEHDPTQGKDNKPKAGKDQPATGPRPNKNGKQTGGPTTQDPSTTPSQDARDTAPGKDATGRKQTAPTNGKQATKTTQTPLQDSRETGYRDGTRAARAAAHVKAYRDGVKDGWTDTTEAAKREKALLDKAHQDRQKQLERQRKDKPVPQPATSAAYHNPDPIEVTGTTPTHIQLGDGAARHEISRGEVRTLKAFERRLEARQANLRDAIGRTSKLKAHADAQAQKATSLKESAQSVEGGDKLIASLTKVEEDAKTQAALADEIHTRAIRAADACSAVLANAGARYDDIYKAVVDSDLNAPAKMSFYQEGTTSHG